MKQYNSVNGLHPLVRFYWRHVLHEVASATHIWESDFVLDFGSGEEQLKPFLIHTDSTNYLSCDCNKDLKPRYSDIGKVRDRVDIVIASNVLEHLPDKELARTVKEFVRLSPRRIVIALPRETSWVNRLACLVFGFTFEHGWEHAQSWRSVLLALRNNFVLARVKCVWFMQWIIVLKPRKGVK